MTASGKSTLLRAEDGARERGHPDGYPRPRTGLAPAPASRPGRACSSPRLRTAGGAPERCRGGVGLLGLAPAAAAAASSPPPALPAHLPRRESGEGPRLRWSWGGTDRTSLGPSALRGLRLQARRGRNKRVPLPAGAGHCATSSGRDGRPVSRRAALVSPALSRVSFRPPRGPAPEARACQITAIAQALLGRPSFRGACLRARVPAGCTELYARRVT